MSKLQKVFVRSLQVTLMLALLLVFQVLQGCSTSDVTAVAQPPTDAWVIESHQIPPIVGGWVSGIAWVIGNVPPSPAMQRVLGLATATGKAVLIQEQTIGRVPVVFESQSRCLEEAPQFISPRDHVRFESRLPHPLGSLTQTNLVMAKGRWVSEVLPTDTYSGVKQFAGVTNVRYAYFLSEDRFSTGTPICVTGDTNGITITLGRVSLPVSSLPLFVEVVDDVARKELGWTNGVLRSNEALTLSVPLRNLPPYTRVVSVHLTNRRDLSLLSVGSYLEASMGWTNGVSPLDTLLKTEKSSVLFSLLLRLDLKSGRIWNEFL